MIFLMLVSLYTSRVILNALGVVDYGIYMAVGGFVAMFGVISNSLTAAISRFITFELGKQDENRIKEVFQPLFIYNSLSLESPYSYWKLLVSGFLIPK